ncbi:MAG: hypothetical protein QM760_20555 [Nibricoccus sp.]
MKLNAALAKSLLMAASIGVVVPLVAQTAPKKDAPKPAPAKPTPAKPAPAPVTPPAEEPEPQLPGSVVARPGGGFLSLTLDGIHFKLSFYDAKKKPVDANAVRAFARWDPVNKHGQERSVLNLDGDSKSMTGNTTVRPPYVFKVYLTLIGADDAVIESHVIDFRG